MNLDPETWERVVAEQQQRLMMETPRHEQNGDGRDKH
jgi:hypothetical protein